MSKVILVTGAGRGLGTDIVREALAAGHQVVATGRRPDQVEKTLGGPQGNLLVTKLDVTSLEDAEAAAQAAVDRFGRIDALINNAGNFFAGYFEEITPAQMRQQIETNLFGPMNVTRAVLPVMRKQRAGHVVTLSSSAGLIGQEFCVAYAASKFGVEGWMESLRYDVEPYGIHTTVVEPGFFRTELLVDGSTTWPEPTIDDYTERTTATITAWKSMNGQQTGDPAKLARALLTIADQEKPLLRFVAGADAIEGVEAKARELLAQAQASRQLGGDLAYGDDNA
ncbi:SDR family oxidoreductase (plasmid) [Streptomyces sp. NBC_01340]|uniref:SDR family oxidoreductase n=1 Tax=unclassified Streptomyces TaxID=2593676 RepID=UPI00225988DA|nr:MULTISPECIES: SDR family oxidoreductase [unclassified Streptomyces]MCX4460276.1 SDR family oxidoreductase [Streptomyces sp. NBC_01719]MCX4500393.1 SDR family oxidoreductase [Streptomyces sp. NBC_01728]MCX4598102.1 SDR family oxidoreductase [Streptomyces sp. NBC_01549]WSI45438.1 SDR family oxidoreductase [Streptomyces sp. NBC_01340]